MSRIFVNFQSSTAQLIGKFNNYLNNSSYIEATGTLIADLLEEQGASTGASLVVDQAFTGGTGSSSVSNVNIEPDWHVDVLNTFATVRASVRPYAEFRITGLPNGASYTLDLLGANPSTRDTRFTVDSGTPLDYIDSADPDSPALPVQASGTVSGGQITVRVEVAPTGTFYGYINGFILEYTEAAPSYTITSIDGDNDVQAGQSNVDIVMTATTGVTSVTLGGESLTINGVS